MEPCFNLPRCGFAIATALAALLVVSHSVVLAEEKAAAPVILDFVRDIRPILSHNCFLCHGPDKGTREADLRLDTKDGLFARIEGKAVVKPGHAEQSELVRRITSTQAKEQMPPADSGKKLTPEQVEKIKSWIAQGAPWAGHWSFLPLNPPEIPSISLPHAVDENGPVLRSPIDAFVAARLKQERLQFSPQANRATLLRRVTLDLTGLPPSPEETAAFLADRAPDAYERVVDRLLESPALGERWAWDWLDAARYADSNGYQDDKERTMWPWRDWVVGAMNRDLSYREFTVWQLAGDLLPGSTEEQKLATGFCRNHSINGEGGRIPEENRVDYVMDMSETTGIVWLGLTLNCCRCHDHKFDALTRRDYYRMFAFFNQTPIDGGGGNPQTPPVLQSAGFRQMSEIRRMETFIAARKQKRQQREEELYLAQPEWEKQQRAAAAPSTWNPLHPASAVAKHQKLSVEDDHSILAQGEAPAHDSYTITYPLESGAVAAFQLETLQHPSHTKGGLSRSGSGNFVLTEIEFALNRVGQEKPQVLKIASAVATFEQDGFPLKDAFDGKQGTGWGVYSVKPIDRSHAAVFRLAEPIKAEPGDALQVTLRFDSNHEKHQFGRFRLSTSSAANAALENSAGPFNLALAKSPEVRTRQERDLIAARQREQDKAIQAISAEIAAAEKRIVDLRGNAAKVMVMADRDSPRKTFVLERGLYNQPGEEVSPGVPASLPSLPPDVKPNRLALANWLVAKENPLTARVTVNRFWQQLFGQGLVKTTEDFGVQGEMPLHRDLLDYLACEFRDQDWSVKELLRLIVTSHTYRQASKTSRELFERDPENRLLARGPRYRLPFYMLRDQALSASGLLVPAIGGAPVNGYQPPGVWEEATFGGKKYVQDKGAALYRRSLYTFWRRIIAPTMFFDNASRQVCGVKALRTNTPLHALLTLNDVTFVEAARALAQGALLSEQPNDAARLDDIFLRVLARPASEPERKILLAGLERSRRDFERAPQEAERLLAVGASPRAERLPAIEHASWTTLCLAVLNLDETLSKE